jgi:hypothetical protein
MGLLPAVTLARFKTPNGPSTLIATIDQHPTMYHVELNKVEEVATKVAEETHVDFEGIFVAQEEEVTRTIISVATVDSVPTKLKIVERESMISVATVDSVPTKLKIADTESMMELPYQQMKALICHRYSKTSTKNKETITPITRMRHQPTE